MTLEFHLPTFDLLEIQPAIDNQKLDLIAQKEASFNIKLDTAVKELYAVANMQDILKANTSYTHIKSLNELGQIHKYDGLDEEYQELIATRKCISIFKETIKGEVEWFIDPDGSPDPKVLLYSPLFPDLLMPHPHSFSKLIYLNAWDNKVRFPRAKGYYFQISSGKYSEKYTEHLQHRLGQTVSTFYLYANITIHRFSKKDAQLLIWDDSSTTTNWFGYASDTTSLEKMLAVLSHFEFPHDIVKPVYAADDPIVDIKDKMFDMLINKHI